MKSEFFSPSFKTQIVLELLRDHHSIGALSQKYNIEQQELVRWKHEFLDLAENLIGKRQQEDVLFTVKKQKSITEIKMKNDFLKKVLK